MKTILRNFLSVIRRFKIATALNILGLSVAFTAFLVIVMQVSNDVGFDSSVPDAENIYRINVTFNGRRVAVAPRPLGEGFAASSPHVKAVAVTNAMAAEMYEWFFTIESDNKKQVYSDRMIEVTAGFVDIFQPVMLEGTRDAILEPDKVLIPKSLAKRLFAESSAIDQQLKGDDFNWVIGGVYKDFPKNSSVKNYIIKQIPIHQNSQNWTNLNYEIYIKIDPSQDAESLFEAYLPQIDKTSLDRIGMEDLQFFVTPLKELHYDTTMEFDTVDKTSRQTLFVLIGIAIVLLLIAAINFTNYSIALTPLRIKSINTQKVMGASAFSLRGSLVVEAVLISCVSFLIALCCTHLLSFTAVTTLLDTDLVLTNHIPLILMVGVISLLTGLFAGLYPSYYVTSFAPALVLKGSFGLSPRGRKLRSSLVGIQFVASFALIVVAMFMYLQTKFMQQNNPGYDKDQVIVTNMNKQFSSQYELFGNELTSYPGIELISFSETLFAGSDTYSSWSNEYKEQGIVFQALGIDLDFLQTMNIPLTEGRDFTRADLQSEEDLYIFNERARKEFGLKVGDKIEDAIVIGFVSDINITSLRKEIEPMMFYLAMDEGVSEDRKYAYLRVKAGTDMFAALEHTRTTLDRLSPGYPFDVRFLTDVSDSMYTRENNLTLMITLFSLLAVLISMVGVFGLVVFESEYRRKEIGLRKVLGSTTGQILEMFNKRYIVIVGICFLIAAPIASYAISKWLENFAYRTPMYWWIFALAFLIVASLTSATVTFQSWRVADANPVDSIKTD